MTREEAFHRFCHQRSNAKRRGIEWCFSFEQWLAWWGDDLDRRGVGHDELQMQRFGDQGPYAPGNVRKGYPRDNATTRGRMKRLANSLQAKAELEAARDAAPAIAAEHEELSDDERELKKLGLRSSSVYFGNFKQDKRL